MEVLDIKELAEYLKSNPQVIRRKTRENAIPHFKVGSRYLFKKETIDNWITNQEGKI